MLRTVTWMTIGLILMHAHAGYAQPRQSDAGGSDLQCSAGSLLARETSFAPRETASAESALQELATQRKWWESQQPASYRLCVITLNALMETITEVDVEQGAVRVARSAWGYEAVNGRAGSTDWSPSVGMTVENLFDNIQAGIGSTDSLSWGSTGFVLHPTYDPRRGYPIHIYSGPDPASLQHVFDADVTTLIRVTPFPPIALEVVPPGDVYSPPKRGRITRPSDTYPALLGFDLNDLEDRIRRLWPKEAPTIIERGNISYWTTVNWEPRLGMLGTILGTFKHPSGRLLYLMEFSHDGVSLYCPFELNGVELTR